MILEARLLQRIIESNLVLTFLSWTLSTYYYHLPLEFSHTLKPTFKAACIPAIFSTHKLKQKTTRCLESPSNKLQIFAFCSYVEVRDIDYLVRRKKHVQLENTI